MLLTGESGTGKGWVARMIHDLSPRAKAPFVEVNCAGLNATFLDSELFGHEKGAFTDAKDRKQGLFEIADHGTIFLDEIGDLAPELQPKLLKVLETKTFRRLGGTREITVDVRLVAATNKDLQTEVEELPVPGGPVLPAERHAAPAAGGARSLARGPARRCITRLMNDLRAELPDGPPTLSSEVLDRLLAYGWPGNVREMRNVLERALILGRGAAGGERRASAGRVPGAARHRRPAPHAAQPRGPRAPAHRAHAQAPHRQPHPRRHRARHLAGHADQQDQALQPHLLRSPWPRSSEHDAMGCRACGREERASEGYPCANCGTFICLICTFPRRDPLPRVRRQGRRHARDRIVIARAAIAPLCAEPTLRSEQVSQLVLGETAAVLEAARRVAAGAHRRRRLRRLGPRGLLRRGRRGGRGRVAAARPPAGARVRWSARRRRARAPSAPRPGGHRRRGGRPARWPARLGCVEGAVTPGDEAVAAARAKAPERWALEHFAGAPYEWGGVTPWGVDCSGLVQTTFLARGVSLPRDSAQQVACGAPVSGRRDSSRAICSSSAAKPASASRTSPSPARRTRWSIRRCPCGGMVQEPWLPGSRAASLRERLVAVRRLEER